MRSKRLLKNCMHKLLHFWPVSGGMGLRFKLLSEELQRRGTGERISSVSGLFKSLRSSWVQWRVEGVNVLIFTSLMCPLIVFLKIVAPKTKVVYFVRGDEINEARDNGRFIRASVAFILQYTLWKLLSVKHVFVSWDLKKLFERRLGGPSTAAVVPNTLGCKVPASRRFDGNVALVGDFDSVKDIEWVLSELINTEFVVSLYGNSSYPVKWQASNVVSFGKVGDLSDRLRNQSLLVLSSKSEGYPNILNEALLAGCAVVVHTSFPFEFFPLSSKWKYSKSPGALVTFLREVMARPEWRYDDDNKELSELIEVNWFELVFRELE